VRVANSRSEGRPKPNRALKIKPECVQSSSAQPNTKRIGAEHRTRTPRSRDGCESAANLERLVGGAEGVERAPHLRHPVPPRLLRPVIILVAVAVPAQRQRHHLLSPTPHRRRRRPPSLSLSLSLSESLWKAVGLIARERSTGGRRWKLAGASGNEHWLAAGPWQ